MRKTLIRLTQLQNKTTHSVGVKQDYIYVRVKQDIICSRRNTGVSYHRVY